MKLTLDLDEQLIAQARRITGTADTTDLVHEGLRALIATETRTKLARFGGSDPEAKAPKRRRPSS